MAGDIPTYVFNPNPTFGALLIGVLISMFLFGLVTMQTFTYFRAFEKDRKYLKGLVGLVWVGELGQAICVAHTIYWFTISMYGNPESILVTPNSFCAAILFSEAIASVVEAFFAHRVRVLSGHTWMAVVLWSGSFLRFTFSTILAVAAFMVTNYPEFEAKWIWLLATTVLLGAFIDVSVAVLLCYYFAKHRRHSTHRTVKLLDKMIMWTIETGLITSIDAVLLVICFLTMQENYLWAVFFMLSSRFYSNSLLASLNARTTIEGRNPTTIDATTGDIVIRRPQIITTRFTNPIHIEMTHVTESSTSQSFESQRISQLGSRKELEKDPEPFCYDIKRAEDGEVCAEKV